MPIYEYVCHSCGLEKEVLQRLSEAPLAECPGCQAATFVKKISAAGFRLKGTGWYETDFKTNRKKNLAGDAAEAAAAGTSEPAAPQASAAQPGTSQASAAATPQSAAPQPAAPQQAAPQPAARSASPATAG